MGERGRLVLPAPVRRALGLREGSKLFLDLDEETGAVRLEDAAAIAEAARGMFRDDSGRSLVDELIEERRKEAEREAGS